MNLSIIFCIMCLMLLLSKLDGKTFCSDIGSCVNCKQNEMVRYYYSYSIFYLNF
jgi:hypothetical protein